MFASKEKYHHNFEIIIKSLELNSYLHKLCVVPFSILSLLCTYSWQIFWPKNSYAYIEKKSIHFLMFYQLENKNRHSDKIDASTELLLNH